MFLGKVSEMLIPQGGVAVTQKLHFNQENSDIKEVILLLFSYNMKTYAKW